MQPQENPARVLLGLHGNSTERFFLKSLYCLECREGHGAMVRSWCFTDVAAYRAVSNQAWWRIFNEISCFSPLHPGTLFRCCVLGQDTSPSNALLDSGEMSTWWNRDGNVYDKFNAPIWLQDCMLSVEFK